MKGKIVWSFWLVAVLAVITATASYAWLAMNTEAKVRGFEVELVSDSVYLEISADADERYGKEVYFDKTLYRSSEETHNVFLVSYGVVPDEGAVRIYKTQIDSNTAAAYGTKDGTYNGGDVRFYLPSESVIGGGDLNFVDVTEKLTVGQSLVGYYVISVEALCVQAQSESDFYYVKNVRENGAVDYCCIGSNFSVGEPLANRKYWGYSSSSDLNDAEENNLINVVSMDVPTDKYCLKKTVFMRGGKGSVDLGFLKISSVEIDGEQHALTSSIRIMFVATSDTGRRTEKMYSHREPEAFDGVLFGEIFGNRQETVTVDMYIFFDGKDVGAHTTTDELTSHTVTVKFSVDG